jgi:putative FmdB family regulatory protein
VPLYEYSCSGCDARFEVMQRLGADGDGVLCPHCGVGEPKRLLSTFAAGGSRDAAAAGEAFCDAGAACCRGAACES